MNKLISICIPTYEAGGKATYLLEDLIVSIDNQTYKNIEIVISDHSLNNDIEIFLEKFKHLRINYYKNESGIGNSSINMNESIKKAKGDFIKIMHMDDLFYRNDTLEIMVNSINDDTKWGAFGFNHLINNVIDDILIPRLYLHPVSKIHSLMGCPSISFFRNGNDIFFDENLIILNDFEFYYRLLNRFGNPLIINDICITIRKHNLQVTSILDNYNIKENEEALYIKNKYNNEFIN